MAIELVYRGGGGSGAVNSVNGKVGNVVLTAADVGALPEDTYIPDNYISYESQSLSEGQKHAARANIGAVSSSIVNDVVRSAIPKNVSQLSNDAGYQTAADVETAINNALGVIENGTY